MSFLDCEITLFSEKTKYSVSAYRKPIAAQTFVLASSNHPRSMLYNSLRNNLLRIMNNSDPTNHDWAVDFFKNRALASGYSTSFVKKVISQQKSNQTVTGNAPIIRLILPFCNSLAANKIQKAVMHVDEVFNIRTQICWVPKTLKQLAVTTFFATPLCRTRLKCHGCELGLARGDCQRNTVVYILTCTTCDKHYIGCTDRNVNKRLTEHLSACHSLDKTQAMGFHYSSDQLHIVAHATSSPFKVRILFQCKKHSDLYVAERYFISILQPAINTQFISKFFAKQQ